MDWNKGSRRWTVGGFTGGGHLVGNTLYKSTHGLGDQQAISISGERHTAGVKVLPSSWNVRPIANGPMAVCSLSRQAHGCLRCQMMICERRCMLAAVKSLIWVIRSMLWSSRIYNY